MLFKQNSPNHSRGKKEKRKKIEKIGFIEMINGLVLMKSEAHFRQCRKMMWCGSRCSLSAERWIFIFYSLQCFFFLLVSISNDSKIRRANITTVFSEWFSLFMMDIVPRTIYYLLVIDMLWGVKKLANECENFWHLKLWTSNKKRQMWEFKCIEIIIRTHAKMWNEEE